MPKKNAVYTKNREKWNTKIARVQKKELYAFFGINKLNATKNFRKKDSASSIIKLCNCFIKCIRRDKCTFKISKCHMLTLCTCYENLLFAFAHFLVSISRTDILLLYIH